MKPKGAGALDLLCKGKMCPIMTFTYDKFEEADEIAKTNQYLIHNNIMLSTFLIQEVYYGFK